MLHGVLGLVKINKNMGIPILSALRTISLISGLYIAVLFVGGVVPLGYFVSVGLINFAVLLTLVRIVNKEHRLATSAIPIGIGGAIAILALLRCRFDSLVFANFVPDSVKIGYLDCSISAFPSIGGMLTGILVCWIIWNCGRQSKLYVSYALVLLLGFELIYGIYAFQKGGLSVIGLGVRASDTYLTGTFGNRGLYSAFVAMISPVALSICLYDKKIPMLFRISVLSILVILIGVALSLSASRLGYLALLTGILGWAVSTVFVKKNELNNRGLILTSMVFLSIVSTSIWFGADKLVERYFDLILSPIRRLDIWMATLDLPWTAWLFGIGVGRFEHVFPIVQPALTQRTFYYLHNDLLQFLWNSEPFARPWYF